MIDWTRLWKSIKSMIQFLLPRQWHHQVRIFYHVHHPRRYLEPLICFGRGASCPMCGGKFRKFLPMDNLGTPDMQCPRCSSFDRHRLLYLFLRDRTDLLRRPHRVLHFAPELCFIRLLENRPGIDYLSADLESTLARANFDITEIPLADQSFDFIICSHVLEHIEDDRRAMEELHRVLQPGGSAFLQVPMDNKRETTFEDFSITSPEEREKVFGQNDHVRIYGRDYVRRLEQAGFKVRAIDYLAELDPAQVREQRLARGDTIHLCTRE